MLRWLSSLFIRKPDAPEPLEVARAARRSAAEAWNDARQRGDTRDEHWALRRYNRATHNLLRLERNGGA